MNASTQPAAAKPLKPKRAVPLQLKLIRAFMNLGHVAPKSIGHIAHRIFITPKGPRSMPRSDLFDRAEKIQTRFQGHVLRGYRWGTQGPVVLLVHGWQSRAFDMKHFVEPLLTLGYRVVAFDGLAHGTSEGRLASFAHSCIATQQLIEEVNPHGIVAHSYGAAASIYTLAKSDRVDVKKIVLIAPIAETTQVVDNFIKVAGVPRRAQPHFDKALQKFWGGPKEYYSMVEFAKSVNTPALMFHDVLDPIVPYGGGKQVAANLQRAEFVTTKGLGHFAVLQDQDVRKRVGNFFGQSDQGDQGKQGAIS